MGTNGIARKPAGGRQALRGMCGVVDCALCPEFSEARCAGCRRRAAADIAGACALAACSTRRGVHSCFACREYPCALFVGSEDRGGPGLRPSSPCRHPTVSVREGTPPVASVGRLIQYLRVAEEANKRDRQSLTSRDFASIVGVKADLVRKDLATLGALGTPRVGYNLSPFIATLRSFLNLRRHRNIVLVGTANAGTPGTLADVMTDAGCRLVAVIDPAARKRDVQARWGDLPLLPLRNVDRVIKRLRVVGAALACASARAQELAQHLVGLGITRFLNLSGRRLRTPAGVYVRHVDLAEEAMHFSLYCSDPDFET